MVEIGDTVTKSPVTFGRYAPKPGFIHPTKVPQTGTVVYVHPQNRYYVVEFKFRNGSIKEAFYD